jgi:uncharacterized protein (TIGR02147 family)
MHYNSCMIYEHTHYRTFLRSTLTEGMKRNPHFSLRALAAKIGIAPSSLSEILKGKKNISRDTALKIARGLRLNKKETEYFCLLADFEIARSDENKSMILDRLQHLNPKDPAKNLALEAFRLISDWYHIAILEMHQLKGFKPTPANIAERLDITTFEAENALERLYRLELIEKNESGEYRKTHSRMLSASGVPDKALQNFHKQMLEKAIQSIANQTPKQKLIGSETFAFDQTQLNAANDLMEEFFNKMVKLASSSQHPSDVYHLGIQFFNLTQGERK